MLHEKNLRAIIVPHMTEVECFNHGGNVVTIKEKNEYDNINWIINKG